MQPRTLNQITMEEMLRPTCGNPNMEPGPVIVSSLSLQINNLRGVYSPYNLHYHNVPGPEGRWRLHFTTPIMERASNPRRTCRSGLLSVGPLGIL